MLASKYFHNLASRLAFGRSSRILAGLLLVLLLVACADDDDDRQFAGDERATGPAEDTPVQPFPTQLPGTPQVLASPISERQLFSVQAGESIAAVIVEGTVYRYDASSDEMTTLPVDPRYVPWIIDVSPNQEQVALLVSPAGSLVQWRVLVFDASGELAHELPVVGGQASPVASSEVVATGTGGMDWSPDGSAIAVALPTGGIYAVGLDGAVAQMSPPRQAARPGDLAWSPTRRALAFANQSDPRSGLGLNVATTTAYPLDAVQLLRPDPTGNRSVSYLEWMPDGSQIIAIVDRKETGGARGDVFAIEVEGGPPDLIWSPGVHNKAGADAISISPDGLILAVLSQNDAGESTVVLRQIGGPSEVQRPLGMTLDDGQLIWTDQGLIVAGPAANRTEGEKTGPLVIRIDEAGDVEQLGQVATPEASPIPRASPIASPFGSPVPVVDASPVGSPVAAPQASPESSPVASPIASPASSPDATEAAD